MEELRIAAREAAGQSDNLFFPGSRLNGLTVPDQLHELWDEISHQKSSDFVKICQNLLLAQGFLKIWGKRGLSSEDETAANNLYNWAIGIALPSAVFANSLDESSLEVKGEAVKSECRRQCTLAILVIELLTALLPVSKAANTTDIIFVLASFTSEEDAWTEYEAYVAAKTALSQFVRESDRPLFWQNLESILKNRIRPIFAKTKNPSLTAAGRKNFHPIPLARFDMSILDPEAKPWKVQDISTTTVFNWIVSQYQASDKGTLEAHFPLLVPPILTLIDDDSTPFKTRGCILLSTILTPIHDSKSDILRRTNLCSVFEDAIRSCLHSLPTITPEDDAISLLGSAYPALRSLLKTSYANSASKKDQDLYLSSTTKTLRDHLIPSFHHISSTNAASSSTFASFPYPRLSTLFLTNITRLCTDLGIHTTKYLQDIIPLLHSTLSNPFGTAHPPLLLASLGTTRAVILNAHPRVWRWRGELLGMICSCWLHICEDDRESETAQRRDHKSAAGALSQVEDSSTASEWGKIKKELQGAVYLLKFALQNPTLPDQDKGQLEAKENIAHELRTLVEADEVLEGCLEAEIDPNDPGFFGLYI